MIEFVEVDKNVATDIIVAHHYLHSRCPITWAWGIKTEKSIEGVLTIGKPQTWSARAFLFGETKIESEKSSARSNDVFELNRLWLSDSLPVTETLGIDRKTGLPKLHRHGLESKFIAWCLRELRKKRPHTVLFSCADGMMGHVGKVYKATNWMYIGVSLDFVDICMTGFNDYRSAPPKLRGGFAYRCMCGKVFPTPWAEIQPPTIRCVCGKDAKRLNKRSWALINRPPHQPTTVVKGVEYIVDNSITDEKGEIHYIYRKPRTIKHRFVWCCEPADKELLKVATLPYPIAPALQTQEEL